MRNLAALWPVAFHKAVLIGYSLQSSLGAVFEVTVFWKTSKWLVLVGILSVLAVPAEALKEVEGFLCDPPLLNFPSVWAS